ncbi:MAG: hypothetical protein ACYDDF_06955 [Thermoplasmatota archaeon]
MKLLISCGLACVIAVAFVPAMSSADPVPTHFVLTGTVSYVTFTATNPNTSECDGIHASFDLVGPGTGTGSGVAVFADTSLACPTVAANSNEYSEALPSVSVPSPDPSVVGSPVFEFQSDHFVQQSDGSWVDDIHFSNGDEAITTVAATGAFSYVYTFGATPGSGFELAGALTPQA